MPKDLTLVVVGASLEGPKPVVNSRPKKKTKGRAEISPENPANPARKKREAKETSSVRGYGPLSAALKQPVLFRVL